MRLTSRFRSVLSILLASLLILLAMGTRPGAFEATGPKDGGDISDRVEHHYARNGTVKIHYVSLGQGPLVVMIHGFPDYWYTWRDQMAELSKANRVLALDLRGYNRSDKPSGVDSYDMRHLVGDVAAVIRHAGKDRATIVGHDWGGAISWFFAMAKPEMTERLIVLNLPHPRGLARELANNPEQRKKSQYAREFQKDGAHKKLSAESLAAWVKEPAARKRYEEAFRRSDFEAMLNYYKRNYPREPYRVDTSPLIKIEAPVLLMHGLDDGALLPAGLNETWRWIEKDLTLITVPGAGHWVHRDRADFVTKRITSWLKIQGELP